MAILKRYNNRAKTTEQTGFGTVRNFSGGRFYTKDGLPNRVLRGGNIFSRFSIYHKLISMPSWKFLFIIFLFFVVINLAFASLYFILGVKHLAGLVNGSSLNTFGEVFFFSAQTFTTVGYGRINPVGFLTSTLASLEAMLGLLSFALATGLLYGRFAKPTAHLKYSKNVLISPYKDGLGLTMRMVPHKNNYLTEVEAKLTMAITIEEDGVLANKFFPLKIEIATINTLAFSWTLVHAINEDSPFYNLTKEDLLNSGAELLVFVKGFDESFSNTVVSRTSYTAEEFVFGAKFKRMYYPSNDGTKTVLNIDRLDDYDEVELPVPISMN